MPAEDQLSVHGRVLDPAGRPLASANVGISTHDSWQGAAAVLGRTHTDDAGAFTLSVPRDRVDELKATGNAIVLAAWAKGFGPAGIPMERAIGKSSVDLQLVKDDVPIVGHVHDPQGKPIANVSVQLQYLIPKVIDITHMDAAGNNPDEQEDSSWTPLPSYAGDWSNITTDATGTFRITGIGANRTADLLLRAPGFAIMHARVLSRPGPTVSKTVMEYLPRTFVTYGSTFDITLHPGTVVEGTITDAATGEPVVDALVDSDWFDDPTWLYSTWGLITARTDAAGHYRMDNFPRGRANRVVVLSPPGKPYLQRQLTLPNQAVARLDVKLHEGVWLAGKVTELGTGAAVHGEIYYTPFRSNPAADEDDFPRDVIGSWPPRQDKYATESDGTFHVAAVPGPGLVGVQFTDKPYRFGFGADKVQVKRDNRHWPDTCADYEPTLLNCVRQIEIPGDGLEDVDLQVDPGKTVKITTLDAQGHPLTGVTVFFRARSRVLGGDPEVMNTSTFDTICFSPDEHRTVVFRDERRKLGKAVEIGPDQIKAGSLTVKLEPLCTVVGHVVDPANQPAAGVRLDNDLTVDPPVVTDASGRFTTTLPTGRAYSLNGIRGDPGSSDMTIGFSGRFTPRAGGTMDIGNIQLQAQRD